MGEVDENLTQRVNILLVDDNAANLQALEAVLDSPEFNLVRAASGEEALRHVLSSDFAVILMDVMMPSMDGFETARMIRSREQSSHIPIIFVTALAKDKRYQELGYETGAVDFLTKPLDEFALKAKLSVFADLFRVKEALRKETEERKRLILAADSEFQYQREGSDREQRVLNQFSARQTTRVTSALHGDAPLRDSVPDIFEEFIEQYTDLLNLALDGRVHMVNHDMTPGLKELGRKLAFLGAGPRDVVDIHKASVARVCKDEPQAKVRVLNEEARFLLVELMGSLILIYKNRAFQRANPIETPSQENKPSSEQKPLIPP